MTENFRAGIPVDLPIEVGPLGLRERTYHAALAAYAAGAM